MALLRASLLALIAGLALPTGAGAALQVQLQGDPVVTEQGTGDGVVAAGDGFDLVQTLLSSESTLTSVIGRVTSQTPGVTVTRSASPFPDAAFGATTTNSTSFQATIGAGVSCGTNIDLTLEVTADQGTIDLPLTVGTGLAGPFRHTDAEDVPRTIPDGSSIVSSFDVSTPGLVKDLRIHIGRITHGYVGDLKLSIEAPDGTTVVLADRQGGNGDDYVDTVFASTGTPITAGSAPFTGTFQAQGDLSVLDGHQQQGMWKLHVADTQLSDTGTLVSWGGDVAQAVCSGNPIPSFTATPNPVAPGATATFDASGSVDPTPGGSIVRYEWDLDGNGSYETDGGAAATTTTSWSAKGRIDVGLRVTDNEGHQDSVVVPVHVTAAPSAALSWLPALPLTAQTVTLDASGSADPDGTIAGYAWDLDGNGSFEHSTGATGTTTTSFATPGTHAVRVRVTDDTGATDVERVDVPVANRPPVAAIAVPGVPVPGRQAAIDGSGSSDSDGAIVRYQWDLDGNGSYETDSGPGSATAQTFPAAGSYTIGLQVTDDQGQTASATRTVVVDAPPLPTLAVWPSPGVVGKPVYFGATGSSDPDGSISRYEWDLDGDGSFELDGGAADSTYRSYTAPGTFTVRLRVTDDRGVSATTSASLRIDSAPETPAGGGTGGGGETPGGGTGPGVGSTDGPGTTGNAFGAALLGPPIQALRLARTKGLSIVCQASAGARCALTLYLPPAAVKRLRLAGTASPKVRRKAIGHVTLSPQAGRDAAGRILLSLPARRALRGIRSARVVVRGVAVDAFGRRVSLTRVILLRG